MNIETCIICPDHYCINSNSKLGKVRVEVTKQTKTPTIIEKVLIENCPIRLEKEKDDIEDRRCY